MHTGPNIERDGLVFGYDTGYGSADNTTSTRFYPGENTTNVVTNRLPTTGWNIANSQGSSITRTFLTENGIPFMRFSNVTNGSDYPRVTDSTFYNSTTVTGTFSTSLEVRGTVGASLRFRIYENGSTKITNTVTLTSDWVRYTFDNQTTSFNLNQPYFNPATTGATYDIRNIQIESKSHTTPFVDGTRSDTESLIDLTKTTNIDVSNVSFDSTGQPTFDGTDDSIVLTNPGVDNTTGFSIELIINPTSFSTSPMLIVPLSGGIDHWVRLGSNGIVSLRMIIAADSTTQDFSTTTPLTTNTNHHITLTFKQSEGGKAYYNGSLESSASANFTALDWTGTWRVGQRGNNTFFYQGELPVLKVYNRVLSADEVQQNYNAYKNRFNI